MHHYQQRILENLTTAVILLDSELTVQYMNPAAEALLAISLRRLAGKPLPDYFHNKEDDGTSFSDCLNSGHPFSRREVSLPVTINTTVTVDFTVTPLIGPGEPLLLIELQQLDRMLRIAREESLLASHQATRSLIRGVAHEIKNPLGGIRGAAQLLQRKLQDSETDEYLEVIVSETDRLKDLVDQMLGPRSLPKLRPVNIHECLERVRSLVLAESDSGVAIQRDYDVSLPEIEADPNQLIQVILNLVRNAQQALVEHQIEEPTIILKTRAMRQFTIGAARHRLVLRVDIIDNGPGIPKDMLETIFYPLVSGRSQGTGLGLSIAQSIIHQYHGLIECESEPGKTIFSLLLPMEQPANTQHHEREKAS